MHKLYLYFQRQQFQWFSKPNGDTGYCERKHGWQHAVTLSGLPKPNPFIWLKSLLQDLYKQFLVWLSGIVFHHIFYSYYGGICCGCHSNST